MVRLILQAMLKNNDVIQMDVPAFVRQLPPRAERVWQQTILAIDCIDTRVWLKVKHITRVFRKDWITQRIKLRTKNLRNHYFILSKTNFNSQSATWVARQAKEPRGKIKNSWQTKVIFQILPNSIKIDGKYKKENQDHFKNSIKKGCKRRALAQHIYGRTQKDLHKLERRTIKL